jgi:hypothetical protein
MLISATIFYGQTRARMKRLIDSLEGKVDAAVFLDGPYKGLASKPSMDETIYPYIAEQCERVGVQYAIFGGEVYDSEPAKRTAALQAARLYEWEPLPQRQNEALGQEKWGIIVDSDEWIETPINWALVEQKGTGTIRLHNWDGDVRAPEREGEGATMVRIIPLLGGLVYGPAHYDLMDARTGIVFSGHDKGLAAPNAPCAVLGHDVGPKTIAAEYEAYNDSARADAEGKLLRISEVADDGTYVVVIMDEEQQRLNWQVGAISRFPKKMLPAGTTEQETVAAVLEKVEPADHPGVMKLFFGFIPDERVDEIVAERQALAQSLAQRDQMLLEHRRRKQARKAAKHARIMDSQRRRGF